MEARVVAGMEAVTVAEVMEVVMVEEEMVVAREVVASAAGGMVGARVDGRTEFRSRHNRNRTCNRSSQHLRLRRCICHHWRNSP